MLRKLGYRARSKPQTREPDGGEQTLRASQSQYQQLFEHATFGIYRSSVDGRFLAANPALAEMLGYARAEELVNLEISTRLYVDPRQRERLVERFRHAETIQDLDVDWRRRDGREIVVRLNGRPVRDAQGDLQAFDMIAEDITRRRALELELQHARKTEALGQLAGGLAHDLANLLTIVRGSVDLALERPPEDQLRSCLREARAAVDRSAELICRMLCFARRWEPELRRLDLSRQVRETAALLRHLLPEGIELQLDLPKDLPPIRADRGALEQILLNLTTNARDAMPDGGALIVGVQALPEEGATGRSRSQLGLTVTDSGTGMPEAVCRQVFDPFFTTKAEGDGTGLGLSTVRRLVEQHSADLEIASQPGQGTAVTIRFPVVEAPD